jgi:hypothetical protein
MGSEGYRRADLFDIEDAKQREALNDLLRSDNVHDYEHHVLGTPMGGCKILLFYRINNPAKIKRPPKEHGDAAGHS